MNRPSEEYKFSGNTDLPQDILDFETPVQFFDFFLTEDLLDEICRETHKYSVQLDPTKPFTVSKSDLRKFIGISIMMSLVNITNSRKYWNETLGNKLITDTMSVKQYETIKRYLHFNDNELMVPPNETDHDRLHKIRPILEHLNERCALIPMEESLSVDEQICATKACHYLKQYLPQKPHKWGYKLFILAGVSGFCYHAEIYSGLENDTITRGQLGEPDLGPSANVVMRLARNIPNDQHFKLYFDNYYTTLPLLVTLEKKNIHCLGTFRRNRFQDVKLTNEKIFNRKP